MVKIILEAGSKGQLARNGYLNLTYRKPEVEAVNFCPPNNLDAVCKDGEAEEIVANEVLAFMPPAEASEAIKHWFTKLSSDGVLQLSFTDVYLACQAAHLRLLNLEQIHNAFLGDDRVKRSLMTTNIARSFLENVGYKIEFISTDHISVTITARKPKNV